MKKITTILMIALVLFTTLSFFSKKKIIGISKIVSHPALDSVERGIMDELKKQGFNDYKFDLQNANGEPATAKQIANKFKSSRVTLAVGIATPSAQALVSTLRGTPIVFSAVTDPLGAGLVGSLEGGEKYVTGVSDMTPVKEQIKLLLKLKKVKTIGNVYNSGEANSQTILNTLKSACDELGIKVIEAAVTNSSEVKMATESIINRVDAIYVGTDNTVVSALNALVDVANKAKVPVVSADPSSSLKYDILISTGFDYYKVGVETGKVVAAILKGKKISQMPTKFIDDPKAFNTVINLDVAEQIGIEIPEDVLSLASKVIKNRTLEKK